MQLRVIHTTDHQFIGQTFTVPYLDLTGVDIPISADVVFSITKYTDLGNGRHKYSNAHYVAMCEEV